MSEMIDHAESYLQQLLRQHHNGVQQVLALLQPEETVVSCTDLQAAAATHDLIPDRESDRFRSIGVLNPNPVAVRVGWTGNRASAGLGLSVGPGRYAVIPVAANFYDLAVDPAALAEDTVVSVWVVRYRRPQRLAAGQLDDTTAAFTATSTDTQIALTANTSTLLLAANPDRQCGLLENVGSANIAVALATSAAIATAPIQLLPGGTFDLTLSGRLYRGPVAAIAAAAANVGVIEA